jgi:hypothetical protein
MTGMAVRAKPEAAYDYAGLFSAPTADPSNRGHLNRSSRPPGQPPAAHQRAPQARRRLVRVRLRQTIT